MSVINCLGKISTRYLLGLSATPNRTDKLEDIFKAYLGDVIYEFKAPQNNSVIVDQYIIDNHGQKEYTMLYNKSEKPNKSAMITNICKYDRRNDFIVDKIKEMHDQGRSILVLSGRCGKKKTTRREKYIQQNKVKKGKIKTSDSSESEDENPEETVKHLDILADKLREKYGIESLIYTGGDKLDKLKKMDTLNVLFSTYNMVNEGFNLPKLNSLIYTTPISDTTQSRGRIMRIQHANHTPLIVDLCDNFGGFDNQGRRRVGDYKKAGYQITKIHLNQDFSEGKKSKVELPKDKKVDDEDDFAFTSETGCLL
jgi:superfamily II DNA or RNA helicase